MAEKRHGIDEIISMLRRSDAKLSKGKKVSKVCKQLGTKQQTCYRWRIDYNHPQFPQSNGLLNPHGVCRLLFFFNWSLRPHFKRTAEPLTLILSLRLVRKAG